MPYGLKNETPKKTAWMEKCVTSVMKNDPKITESSAIAICKSQLIKESKSETSFRNLEEKLHKAIQEATDGEYAWIADIFPEYFVLEVDSGFYRVEYSMLDEKPVVNYASIKRVDKYVEYREIIEQTYSGSVTYGSRSI